MSTRSESEESAKKFELKADEPFTMDFAPLASGYVMFIGEDMHAIRNVGEIEGNIQALCNQAMMFMRDTLPAMLPPETLRLTMIVGTGDSLVPTVEDTSTIERILQLLGDLEPNIKDESSKLAVQNLLNRNPRRKNVVSNFAAGLGRNRVEEKRSSTSNAQGKRGNEAIIKKDGYETTLE